MNAIVRPFAPYEWPHLREIRLQALKDDPQFFCAEALNDRRLFNLGWKELCRKSNEQCMFGLYVDNKLVGLSMARKSGDMILFGGSWIKRSYRNSRHANLLYGARVEWLKNNIRHNQAFVFHRDGNAKSSHLNRKHGAVPVYRKPMAWADGKTAMAHWFKIGLG